jgi:outer membrane protein OmpA-like peptidoglycan-associated protein
MINAIAAKGRRSVFRVGSALAALVVLSVSAPLGAQERMSTMRLRVTANPGSYLITENAVTLEHLVPAGGLLWHFDHYPLEAKDPVTKAFLYDEIAYQMPLEATLAVGLWNRFEVGLVVPVVIQQEAARRPDAYPAPPSLSAGLGDIRLVPKGRVITFGYLSAAVSVALDLPTGRQEEYLGDGGFGVEPRAIASVDYGRYHGAVNVGYRLRPPRAIAFGETRAAATVDDELVVTGGLRVDVFPWLTVLADGYGAFAFADAIQQKEAGELLGAVRLHLLPVLRGLHLTAGGGLGFGRAVGTPIWRLLGGVHWQLIPVRDRDGDKIEDRDDDCPDDPEDRDGFEDDDGCPDNDNDRDGVPDKNDKCPNKAEDRDGFEDSDGCPDEDNDGDGILDADDQCPDQPEDRDGFQDSDGCPDLDNDGDRIPDAQDECPNQPETFNEVDDEDGCPDRGKGDVQIDRGKITVPAVYFATKKDVILRRSFPTLQRVAELIKKNDWIRKLHVEGHTDSRGTNEFNEDLSQRRAANVVRFLINNGVEPGRLESRGYGEERPVGPNTTRKGRAANRRVEFLIIDPATARPSEGGGAEDAVGEDEVPCGKDTDCPGELVCDSGRCVPPEE